MQIRLKVIILTCCLLNYFAWHNVIQVNAEIPIADYIFETIEVPGVNYLEVAASNDFGDYAGNTRSPDGDKIIGFTLIDDVFKTYDFTGSVKTNFYGLDNVGTAVGHYIGTDGLYHGVVLENGALTQYDFPGAVQTFIYGISDHTGALSGNIVDETGVTRGFSGDLVITYPGAVKTYADFVNAAGVIVGSYVDTDEMPHGYMRNPDGSFITIDIPETPDLSFIFVNAINDVGVIVFRAKAVDDIQRSYILIPGEELQELRFPGSVNTVVRNINQDGSIIGYYDSTDGRRLGFVGHPNTDPNEADFGNIFSMRLTKGLNMISVPLAPRTALTAKSLAGLTGSTMVIALDADNQRFIGWTPNAPDDGFSIEGGQGYIVNVPAERNAIFVGAEWRNDAQATAAPPIRTQQEAWAFVVSGYLDRLQNTNGYHVTVRNLRTNSVMKAQVRDNYFAAATADLSYRSVVKVGDKMAVTVTDTNGNIASDKFNFEVTPASLANAFLSVTLEGIGTPKRSQLIQNYPNPFNPETWIPYRLSEDSNVSITIYDAAGKIVRTFSLGFQSAGFYQDRGRAAYWDGKNAFGESVASGLYFYRLATPTFEQTRRLIVIK